MEVLVGQVLVGGPWSLAIYCKGASTLDLPGQWTLGFRTGSGVEVPVMSWSFVSVLGAGKVGDCFWVQLEATVLSSGHASASWLVVLVCYL